MKRQTISVVLMTKNEERRIGETLEAVRWADEIVIVDDESTDATVEICKRYNAKIIISRSGDHHDKQWNIGIDNSTSDWVLHIDADETVTPGLKGEIEKVLIDSKGFSAFKIMRKNYFLGHFMRYGGWYHPVLILFKRNSARCIGKGIHVNVKVDGEIGLIKEDIIHRPFESISQFIIRHDKYTTKEAEVMLEEKGIISNSELKSKLRVRPLKVFWKMYVKKQGFREGYYGLVFSVLYAWVEFIRWAKYWELTKKVNAI